MSKTDRLGSPILEGPWHPNVKTVALVNVSSLSGEQTISSVALTSGHRVLLTAQTDKKQNGPWIVQRGAWIRPRDWSLSDQAAGALFLAEGGSGVSRYWRITTEPPIVIGTTDIEFAIASVDGGVADGAVTAIKFATGAIETKLGYQPLGIFSTRTALKAVSTSIGCARLTEAGRDGTFAFLAGDYSTHVTADTAEGIYIKADAVPASVGAWVRRFVGPIFGEWYGTSTDIDTLTAAIAANKRGTLRTSSASSLTGIALSHSQGVDGFGSAVVNAAVGANVFTLGGYGAFLNGVYIADNRNSTGPAVKIAAATGEVRIPRINDLTVLNADQGVLKFEAATAYSNNLAQVSGVHGEGIEGIGIDIGSSVSETKSTNIHLAGILDYSGGLGRPRSGVIGWKQNTPIVGSFPVGGHQATNVNVITCDVGQHITDGQYSKFTNFIADSTRDYGVIVDGASVDIEYDGLFIGSSMGLKVAGTSSVTINKLATKLIGVIPPWGQNPFYNSAGPYYAVTVADTATLVINGDAWSGTKTVSVASGAKLIVAGGYWMLGRNIANIAAGATEYLTPYASAPTESDAYFRAPFTGVLMQMNVASTDAPGAGQTATFTVRLSGVDTALVATLSGAAEFSAQSWSGSIAVTKGQPISIKCVKSAGAAAAGRYVVNVQMLPA